MESDIRSLTKEMKSYLFQITKADYDNSLTTIQKKEYQDAIKKTFEAKEIRYSISIDYDYGDDNHSFISFPSPPWYVNEVGIINDVSPQGAYPFSISIGDNISIKYDPRNLKYKDSHNWDYLKNKEFLNFQKGSEYKFKGKISYCAYYFKAKPKERFIFEIIGGGSQNDHCFIATAAFGNKNHIEVIELRTFRDKQLMNSLIGRLFVKFYYTVSPTIACLIRQSKLLRKMTRLFLQKLILPLIKHLTTLD